MRLYTLAFIVLAVSFAGLVGSLYHQQMYGVLACAGTSILAWMWMES